MSGCLNTDRLIVCWSSLQGDTAGPCTHGEDCSAYQREQNLSAHKACPVGGVPFRSDSMNPGQNNHCFKRDSRGARNLTSF
jgi:hypothetical protein